MESLEERIYEAILGGDGIIGDLDSGCFRWEEKTTECLKLFKEVESKYSKTEMMPTDLVITLIDSVDQLSRFRTYKESSMFYFDMLQALGELAGKK